MITEDVVQEPQGVVMEDDQASPGEISGPADQVVKFVSFYLGENLYAIHAPAVSEVSQALPVTRLPGAPENVLGIAPLRGEIVALTDVRRIVDEPTARSSPKSKVLVLRPMGSDDVPLAFPVDKMGEIVSLSVNGVMPVSSRKTEALFGVAIANGKHYFVIDHTNLSSIVARS